MKFVYIVDDEADVRASLRALLSTRFNLHLVPCQSGDAFLDGLAERDVGVVLLDMNMPGRSGADVLRELAEQERSWPVVVITGQGNIAMAVEAMQLGAVDFLEKPYDHRALFRAVDEAFDRLRETAAHEARQAAARELLDRLTARENEVLDALVMGASNKVIAADLGLSIRTVELHRANAMGKLEARSLPDAIRLVFAAQG